KKRYEHLVQRIRNSFLYFLGVADDLLKSRGVLTFIIPNEFLFQIYMEKARKYFLVNREVRKAINVGEDIFDAIVPSCVVTFTKQKSAENQIALKDLRGLDLQNVGKEIMTDSSY